jgi:endonuclease YncB( thermonuclease family)
LKSATKILVQSVKGGSFRESYGRLLGFVWYATVENPQLCDFKLLNYELILEGYANLGAEDDLKELYSEYSYYKSYFEFAFLWAQKSGKKIHGEIDPDFEY